MSVPEMFARSSRLGGQAGRSWIRSRRAPRTLELSVTVKNEQGHQKLQIDEHGGGESRVDCLHVSLLVGRQETVKCAERQQSSSRLGGVIYFSQAR